MTGETAILLVAHGTPGSLDDIPAFLRNIRRGRPAPPAVVDAVRSRYQAIGGSSPLLATTRRQAAKLARRTGLPCEVATRMWHPTFLEVLEQVARARLYKELIVVCAAPHSAHVYAAAVRDAAHRLEVQHVEVPTLREGSCWGTHPAFIRAWASKIRATLERLGARKVARAMLIPSAHSLPMRTVQAGDPYPNLVAQTADAVVRELGRDALRSMLAYQSQGMSNEPWLGPDLATVFDRAVASGAQGVVVVPVGFPAEHVETLYDLDIEAPAIAKERGLWFERVPCLDTDDGVIEALAAVVQEVRRVKL